MIFRNVEGQSADEVVKCTLVANSLSGETGFVHDYRKYLKAETTDGLEKGFTLVVAVVVEMKFAVLRQSYFGTQGVYLSGSGFCLGMVGENNQGKRELAAGSLSNLEPSVSRLVNKDQHGLFYRKPMAGWALSLEASP